jgi:hypothetical protein
LTIAALIWAGAVIIARAVHVAAKKPSGPAAPARWLTGALAVGSHFASFWAAHAARLALCLLFFAGVHACGRWALEGILEADRDAETEALRPLFSIALGLGLVGYLAFFMAAAGLSGRGWADAGFAMVSGLGAWNLRRFGKRPRIASFSWLLERRGILERGALLFLAAGLAYSFLGTTVPEVFYDALVYHLAVPQAYLASGRMVDLPYNHYSYLPLFVSMLYYWALAAGGMYAAKIFAFFLGLCLLAALVAGGRFFKDWGSGLVAAALFLGAPLVLLLFWECNSDGGAAFYLALSILSFAQWRRRGADARRWLYLSGLMGGLALASKYTTAIGVACLAFAAFVATSRAGLRRRLGTLMLYAALMMAPLLPWWVRNGVYAGNPFYPYLAGVLGGPNAESALLEGWRADARGGSPGFHPSAMAAKIWRDAMRGFEHPSYYDTGPAFVAFLPWTAWAVQETWGPFLAVYAASAYGLGLCATYVTRFLTPYLIPVCWLLAVGIVAAAATRAVALCLGTLLAASLFANLYQLSKVTLGTSGRGLAVAEGLMTPETYLSKQRNLYPQPSYGAWSYLRKYGLPKEGAILLIGDSRAFYSPAPTIAGAPYDPPPAFAWARASRDPEELWRKLREEGVSVVVSNGAELQRDYPAAYRDDRRSIAMISRTLKDHFKLVYQDRYAVVYLLRNPASSS